ncbi:MAG TPA: hypothetical protein VFZ71_10590, partial [Pyrinomonadaceae bacterium]
MKFLSQQSRLLSCLVAVLISFSLLTAQTPPKKTEPQKPIGGASTGAPATYTSRRTTGITDPNAP